MPKAHDSHPPAPSGPVVPALQVHSFEDDPLIAENLPASHTVHSADPAVVLYLPISHDRHMPSPSDPVVPASQVQTFSVEPDTIDDFPVAHSMHNADPAVVLYLPKSHDEHVANPSDPVVPASHVHTFSTEAATAEFFPVSHNVQDAVPDSVL